jgi:hypothetical protein
VLNPRKLAAIDLAFLGPKVIISEFAFGVLFSTVLGVFVLLRGHRSPVQIALGLYFISLGLNYVPMLVYAIAINKAKSALTELDNELDDKRTAMKKISSPVSLASYATDRPHHRPDANTQARDDTQLLKPRAMLVKTSTGPFWAADNLPVPRRLHGRPSPVLHHSP